MSLFNNKEKKIKKFRKKHKIGLCLSGGGTKGLSYIGAFKAFEEHNILFDMVAGTSVGSLFAALYASGFTSEEITKIAKNVKTSDFRKSKLGFLPSKMDLHHI
jgi:NTE family protein